MAEREDRAAFAAAMTQHWRFLLSWCQVLKRCMHDGVQRVDGEVVVRVSLPSRPYSGNRLEKDQATFRKEFQEVQEGLVSLAAVAYIDYPAYRYLISAHVGVMLGNPGEELFAAVVKVKFILWVDEEGRVGKNEDGTVEYDLTQFCGPQQFEHSDKFIKALNQIAAFDEKLGQSDAVITIPVKVNFQVLVGTGNNYARSLLDIKEAEQAIKARWSSYVYNEKGANENLSFRFVLEPMILDICCADMTLEMVKSVENLMLVHRNCFKRVDIHLEDEFASVQATQQLMTCICDTSHRFRGPPNTNYHYELENSTEIYEPPQVGTLELMCDESMQESAFAAFWSAVVLTQSTKNLVFCMESMMNIDRSREHWWKWVAYGLFSKLALVLQLKL